MNKQDMLKIQTCVLKVNIHCDGCKQKIKKKLLKIEGVYSVKIDVDQGKVTVSGNVDPATLIKKLDKSGKRAELWGAQKGHNPLNNQFEDIQFDNFKGGKDNKSQKGGKDQQKGGNQALHQMQQNKGMKDVKFPGKDQKSVKFKMPEEEEDDEFDDDFDGHQHQVPNKMMNNKGSGGGGQGLHGHNAMKNGPAKGSGGNKGGDGKKSSGFSMFIKSLTGKGKNKNGNEGKNGKGGNQNHGGDKNGGKKKGGSAKGEGKNGAASGKGAKDGGFGGKNNDNWGGKQNIKGGSKQQGFDEIDVIQKGGAGARNMGPMGQMGNYPMGQMGNMPAVQGLPAMNSGMNSAHYQGMGPGNPYAMQQNMAQMMMMNQQRANGHDMHHPMMHARQPPPMSYGPPPGDHYTQMFSDENATGCSIM
ncbi:heavy metal-associated isoprenylated plant 34 [Olea europaea subsp. europaea]|uniref:Heavy metal-associated isoprenylated plant 34 n=2 Tax=Olea europaea subsp. europaea TaxID=158383 RepID=A0A8S0PNS1_OLEEU|nr:heavy metal-associated isoprenylated plant 34 [Olea europaea subsp. europaea]